MLRQGEYSDKGVAKAREIESLAESYIGGKRIQSLLIAAGISLGAGLLIGALTKKRKSVALKGGQVMIRHTRTNSSGLKGPTGSAKQVARGTFDDVQAQLPSGYQGLTATLAKRIRGRPVESVLVALGAGLLLGRFKARPVETVLLTSAAGFFVWMALANSRRCAQH